MELAHAPSPDHHADHHADHDTDQDAILAAFLEPGALPDIARRINMSLAALATWAAKHAELLANVHTLLVTRCKLIAAQLELSALSSLAAVSNTSTHTDDAKLRERALERQRKAASFILRHNTCLQRKPSELAASSRRNARPTSNPTDQSQATSASPAARRTPNVGSFLDALMPPASMPSSSRAASRKLASRKPAALSTA